MARDSQTPFRGYGGAGVSSERGELSRVAALRGAPVPPGKSPFCVKGIFHRGNIEYIERAIPGGLAKVLGTLRDPALRSFFEQPFIASSWYDIFPLAAIAYPCAELSSKTYEVYLRDRARYQAEQQGATTYRSLLTLTSPSAVALKLPLLASQLYNFGATEAREVGPRKVEVVRSGLPFSLASWYVLGTETYVTTALSLSGATKPRARTSPYRTDGKLHGLSVGSVCHTFSWD